MGLFRHTILIAIATWTTAVPGFAQDPSQGRVTLAGEAVTFAPPVAFWDPSRNRVSVAFYTQPLPADAEASARKAGQWPPRPGSPTVILDVDFAPGSMSAMDSQVRACHVSFHGFRSQLDLKGSAKDCHIFSIGGLLRPGGAMVGVLQGEGPTYSLRLPFSAAFLDAGVPTTPAASAAPAVSTAPAAPTAPAIAANTASGTASYNGQRLTLTHGLAAWNAKDNEVRVWLFEQAPRAGILKDLLAGSWGDGGPTMTIYLRLAPGGPVAPASITYCYVDVTFPKGGPIGRNVNSAAACGLTQLGGEPRAGGTVLAQIAGSGPAPQDRTFSWDVRFHLPIAR